MANVSIGAATEESGNGGWQCWLVESHAFDGGFCRLVFHRWLGWVSNFHCNPLA
jgi:hypothetical protein